MSRQRITSGELHARLVRAYLDARVVDCVSRCPMPDPIFRESHGDGEPNWYVRPSVFCPRHCHRVIADVVAKLGAVYDLDEPPRIAIMPAA